MKHIYQFLRLPLISMAADYNIDPENLGLVVFKPQEGFAVVMKTGMFAGLVLSTPFSLYFLAQFILPALTRKERKFLLPGFLIGGLLFVAGLVFCYRITLPMVIRLFWRFNTTFGFKNLWNVNFYLSFVMGFMLANGIIFEVPLVLYLLVRLGILSVDTLKQKRRHAFVGCFIAGAALSPPDPASMFMVALPMLVLYEACIWASVLTMKKRKREEAEGEKAY